MQGLKNWEVWNFLTEFQESLSAVLYLQIYFDNLTMRAGSVAYKHSFRFLFFHVFHFEHIDTFSVSQPLQQSALLPFLLSSFSPSALARRRGPQASLTHCLMKRANRQANPSVGKEYKRFRFQTFAQSEYAEFDETAEIEFYQRSSLSLVAKSVREALASRPP